MSIQIIREIRHQGTPGAFMLFLKHLSEAHGWGWSFETVTEFSLDILEDAWVVKVDPSLSSRLLEALRVLPAQVRSVRVIDSLFKEDGAWYPRLLLHEAIREVFVSEARDLDVRAPGFVIGCGEEARVVVSVLALMGVGDIYLVGEREGLEEYRDSLRQSHFGIRFHVLPIDELTMQAVSAGIAVNTVDLSRQEALLTDLSYFNYMKGTGYVLDLNLSPLENLLLEEAEKADLRVLHPVLVAEALTRLWLDRLRPDHGLNRKELHDSWIQFLKQNSSSV